MSSKAIKGPKPFQKKWTDEQIRFILNSHPTYRGQELATLHNERFPDLAPMTAEQAGSVAMRYRNDPRFNSEVAARNAATQAGTEPVTESGPPRTPAATSTQSGDVPGAGTVAGTGSEAMAMNQGFASPGFGDMTGLGGTSSYRAGQLRYADQNPDDDDDGSFELRFPASASRHSRQRSSPIASPDPSYRPRTTSQGHQPLQTAGYQHQPRSVYQYVGNTLMRRIKGTLYHPGSHDDCTIDAPHRHNEQGEVIFPSAQIVRGMLDNRDTIARNAGRQDGFVEGHQAELDWARERLQQPDPRQDPPMSYQPWHVLHPRWDPGPSSPPRRRRVIPLPYPRQHVQQPVSPPPSYAPQALGFPVVGLPQGVQVLNPLQANPVSRPCTPAQPTDFTSQRAGYWPPSSGHR